MFGYAYTPRIRTTAKIPLQKRFCARPDKTYKNALLLAASLIFYAWGEAQYLVLLLVSIVANYFFGLRIAKSKREISLAIAFNLLLLAYFKYANFIAANLPFEIHLDKIHLPIGISFFTFHAISYLVDIYRQKCTPQKNIFDLALYIAFFPQLVAGPIVRYNFIERYLTKRRYSWFFVAYGIRRFIIGLGKKVIIANPLGEVADAIFALSGSEMSTELAWIGIICYTLQIYFDFSGYSDMALGLARVFGFRFPENFNYPYISCSIREFWRRWHISLSAWFRDYVYISLGGNRVPLPRQYFNLVLVFFLCGLWHGASWNFVIWGMFHGVFLMIESSPWCQTLKCQTLKCLTPFYVMMVVMIGWVFFRSPDLAHAAGYLHKMFFFADAEISIHVLRLITSHFAWMALGLALLGFSPLVKNISLKLIRLNKNFLLILDLFLLVVLVLAVIRLSATTHNPFIYFQF
ncbi:MAG: MBOAT family protein [Alphaproteobacteria bacterium]|nr:MBOAT family protein [Alphaproteobacteria bacterium]